VRRGITAFPNAVFIHLYGATETAPLVTGLANEAELIDDDRGRSAGQASLGREVVIRDQAGERPIPLRS